jgi:hypothetical protein
MKKEEFIKRRGDVAYSRRLKQQRQWKLENSEKVKVCDFVRSRKVGKYYLKRLRYEHSGLRGERNKIRANHSHKWQQYKKIIAPDSQIHHEWIPGTAKYQGVALVEKDQHQHGIIDIIQILDGEITLRIERESKSIYIS